MYSAFTDHPDFAPYTALPSMDLTTGVTGWTAPTTNSTLLRRLTSVPAAETAVEQQWVAWSLSPAQHLTGSSSEEDEANPAQLNRLDWYSAHGWRLPYPGDPKIYAPDQVPGHNLPAGYLGDD